jgi:vacuolar protein sorting-associated protein 35
MIANDFLDEDKWLAEGIAAIQHNAFFMHRALVLTIIYSLLTFIT